MPSTNWTLSDDQTLAEYVKLDDFKGITQNRIGISPDHVALLMRDGQIVDSFTGAHFAFGGIWQRMKEFLGGKHSMRLLVASLKPFNVEGTIEGLTKDNVSVAATAAVEFQVNPEKPANILGLMKERDALTRPDIYRRLIPHLRDRVFSTVIRKVDAGELRGNTLLQDKVQAEVLVEVDRLFKDLGVMARAVSLSWGTNEEERAAIARSNSEREQKMLDYQAERKKRELARDKEAQEFVLQSDLEIEKLKASSEDELKHLLLKQELNFVDAREEGVRVLELKKLDHELEVLNRQRLASYKKSLEDAQNEADRAAIRMQLTKIELEIEQIKEEQKLRVERLREEQAQDLAGKIRRRQLEDMKTLGEIDAEADERTKRSAREDRMLDHELSTKSKQLDRQAELDRLTLQSKMSPDQILAISAGLSPDVARIFSERAKAEGVDFEKREAMLREMVQLTKEGRMASEDQARYFFDKAMQGVQGVASGRDARQKEPAADANDTVECSNCHRQAPSRDRFCRFCGHPMRS